MPIYQKNGRWCHKTADGGEMCHASQAEAEAMVAKMGLKKEPAYYARSMAAKPGKLKTEKYKGKDHLVVPVTALVEGVIHASNSEVAELVLSEEFSKNAQAWNGRPVMLDHPKVDGAQVSANDPRVMDEFQIGTVFNARVEDSRLMMDAYIDPEKLESMGETGKKMLADIRAGKTGEVSVGTYVAAEERSGRLGDKTFKAVWRDIASDHLAFLPPGIPGACSVEMGCGSQRAASSVVILEFSPRAAGDKEGHEFHGNQHTQGGGSGGSEGGKAYADAYRKSFDSQMKDYADRQKRGEVGHMSEGTAQAIQSVAEKAGQDAQAAVGSGGGTGAPAASIHDAVGTLPKDMGVRDSKAFAQSSAADQASAAVKSAQSAGDKYTANYQAMTAHMNASNAHFKLGQGKLGALHLKASKYHDARAKQHAEASSSAREQYFNTEARRGSGWEGFFEDEDAPEQDSRAASCGCGGSSKINASAEARSMQKKERVAAIIASGKTCFKAADAAVLEQLSDEAIDALEVKSKEEPKAPELPAEVKALVDAAKAEAAKTPEQKQKEFFDANPDINTIVTQHKAAAAARRVELVSTLKTAQKAYNEDELNALPTEQLEKLAQITAVPKKDFSGAGPAAARAAAAADEGAPKPPSMRDAVLRIAGKKS